MAIHQQSPNAIYIIGIFPDAAVIEQLLSLNCQNLYHPEASQEIAQPPVLQEVIYVQVSTRPRDLQELLQMADRCD